MTMDSQVKGSGGSHNKTKEDIEFDDKKSWNRNHMHEQNKQEARGKDISKDAKESKRKK